MQPVSMRRQSLLLQLANFTYAAGQVMYKHLVARYPSNLPHYRRFGYFYLGALLVVLPAFLLFGKADFLPQAPLQWGVLLFLGLAFSGAYANARTAKIHTAVGAIAPALGLALAVFEFGLGSDLVPCAAAAGVALAITSLPYVVHRARNDL